MESQIANKFIPTFCVVIGILTTSFAQILLKKGSVYEILTYNWILFLVFSVLSYFISFICYYIALRYYEISKICPIMMASTVTLVVIYGILITGETINIAKITGVLLAFGAIFSLSIS